MGDYWIKLYIEMLDDPKIGTLPDGLCWRFVQCCLMAGRCNLSGNIPDTRQLAWAFRLNTNDLEHEMQQLAAAGLVERTVNGWIVKNFAKRQSKMTNAEKQKAYRERLHSNQYSDDSVTEALPKVTQITDNRIQITDNREQITEAENGASPFDIFQRELETRGVLVNNVSAINAINEMLKAGATVDDLRAGLAWKAANSENRVIYAASLVGPTKTAIQKRKQNGNGHIPQSEYIGPNGEVKRL